MKDKQQVETIAVPVTELKKLERMRSDLYSRLSYILTDVQLASLLPYTGQIWKIANTKDWNVNKG